MKSAEAGLSPRPGLFTIRAKQEPFPGHGRSAKPSGHNPGSECGFDRGPRRTMPATTAAALECHAANQSCATAGGCSVLYVEHYLLPSRFPGLLDCDLEQSLTRLYAEQYGIRYGRSCFDIVPGAARGAVARGLNLADGAPVLLITRINYDEQGRLSTDREYWRHDAVAIRIESAMP